MAKSNKELLDDIHDEARGARQDMGSARSGLVRPGETSQDDSDEEDELLEEDESEQDFDTDQEDEDDPDEESESDDDDEEDGDDGDQQHRSPSNSSAAQRRILQKKDDTIQELQTKLTELQEAGTKSEQESLEQQIDTLAGELNLDQEGLNKIANVILSAAEQRLGAKLPSASLMEFYEKQQEDSYFQSEWQGFLPDIAKQYPRASAAQLEQARAKMDEIAHSEAGGVKVVGRNGKPRLQAYGLDYILFKNKRAFDRILSNSRRHGIESSSMTSVEVEEGEADLTSARGVDQMDRKYRNIEATSSGLRRGRSPRSRSI